MPKLVHHTGPKHPAHRQESWLLQQATLSHSPWISKRAPKTKIHSQTKHHHGTMRTSSIYTILSRQSNLGPMISIRKIYDGYTHGGSRIVTDTSAGVVRIQRDRICNIQSTCSIVLARDVILDLMASLCGMTTSRTPSKMVIFACFVGLQLY